MISYMDNHNTKCFLSFVPVIFLAIFLFITIYVFGTGALEGGSQVALLMSAALCCTIAKFGFNIKWHLFEMAIGKHLGDIGSAIFILLLIGALSGIWMVSGIVPTLIFYGVQIINPDFFLFSSCIICCIVSVMTGSSWTTIATIGIALLGIGKAQGFSDGWIAGAIISGAYFGDKLSPLSDTTVLASSLSGTPLFTHIRYMLITTIPSLLISLIVFLLFGFQHHNVTESLDISLFMQVLDDKFNISLWLLVVPVVTAIMIAKKIPSNIVLFLSVLIAAIFAMFFQSDILLEISGKTNINFFSMFEGTMKSIYGSTSIETHNDMVNSLLVTRGMEGMLNTIWLIICAVCFGSCMTSSGMLDYISAVLIRFTHTRVGLVFSTVVFGMFCNCIMADQYLSIILTSNIFKGIYKNRGFENRLLSRSIEDSSTVTSPLIPWSTCGMTQASILNIPTITYLPYCVFNLVSPLMSVFISIIGFKIYKRK